jgi:hypothetical protein
MHIQANLFFAPKEIYFSVMLAHPSVSLSPGQNDYFALRSYLENAAIDGIT